MLRIGRGAVLCLISRECLVDALSLRSMDSPMSISPMSMPGSMPPDQTVAMFGSPEGSQMQAKPEAMMPTLPMFGPPEGFQMQAKPEAMFGPPEGFQMQTKPEGRLSYDAEYDAEKARYDAASEQAHLTKDALRDANYDLESKMHTLRNAEMDVKEAQRHAQEYKDADLSDLWPDADLEVKKAGDAMIVALAKSKERDAPKKAHQLVKDTKAILRYCVRKANKQKKLIPQWQQIMGTGIELGQAVGTALERAETLKQKVIDARQIYDQALNQANEYAPAEHH